MRPPMRHVRGIAGSPSCQHAREAMKSPAANSLLGRGGRRPRHGVAPRAGRRADHEVRPRVWPCRIHDEPFALPPRVRHVLLYGERAPLTTLTTQRPEDGEIGPGWHRDETDRFGLLARRLRGRLLEAETPGQT